MNATIEKTIKALEKRLIRGWAAADAAEAREIVTRLVPEGATVGVGDSSSVRQVAVIQALAEKGHRVLNPFDLAREASDLETHFEYDFEPMLEATICDVYVTGSNAITEDGKIVNIDGNGNRVAGMFWGHPLAILIMGKNKITKNLDEAIDRVKNVISPEHLRRKGAPAPCTKTGHCHDCVGPGKVCAVTTIIERKTVHTDLHVVLVDEDLGLGWDRSWPAERIDRIVARHEEYMCLCPLPEWFLHEENTEKLWQMARAKRKWALSVK